MRVNVTKIVQSAGASFIATSLRHANAARSGALTLHQGYSAGSPRGT